MIDEVFSPEAAEDAEPVDLQDDALAEEAAPSPVGDEPVDLPEDDGSVSAPDAVDAPTEEIGVPGQDDVFESQDTVPPSQDDSLPAAPEVLPSDEELPPAEDESQADGEVSSGGGGGGSDVSLDSALGSLTAYLDTRSQLELSPELELTGIETFALSPITSSEGLKGILLEVIGPYDNIVTQYKYQQSSNQYYTYVNEVTPDYPWIASAGLFIALVISLFSLLKRSFTSWLK